MKYGVFIHAGRGFTITYVAKSSTNKGNYAGYLDVVDAKGRGIPYPTSQITVSFLTKEAAWDSVKNEDWILGDNIYGEEPCTT